MKRKIRMGMIGGGTGAFIGGVHRIASRMDGLIDLVCGAFSSNPERSISSGRNLFIPEDRCYPDYKTMIEKESQLPLGERMDFVSIVTPNHMHFGPSKLALENGFHVVCDKPLCMTIEEAKELKSLVDKTGLLFCLTHNYTGYPMVKQAKKMIESGEIGKVRKVVAEYPQGWLSTLLESTGQKQAAWRTDPTKAGMAGALGDIGTHAENLAEYITGLKIKSICADVDTLVEGRVLDDDTNILLKFDNGAKGILSASQISAGEENNLRIKVYGEKAGLEWSQMEPNSLVVKWLDKASQVIRTGVGELSDEAQAATRIPAGHPEGYLEAFANLYKNFALSLNAHLNQETITSIMNDYPKIDDGVRGMQFISKVIESGQSDHKWIDID